MFGIRFARVLLHTRAIGCRNNCSKEPGEKLQPAFLWENSASLQFASKQPRQLVIPAVNAIVPTTMKLRSRPQAKDEKGIPAKKKIAAKPRYQQQR
jgi:hypothetical protein